MFSYPSHPQDDISRPNDFSRFPQSLTSKRPQKEHLARTLLPQPTAPLSISTNLLSSSARPSSPSSAKLRSPYISSRQTASPISLSPRPVFRFPALDFKSPLVDSKKSPVIPTAVAATAVDYRSSSHDSSHSSVLEDVLQPGDLVGEGVDLQGEIIRLVATAPSASSDDDAPAREFEVVRRLGAGSYAVVYQVLEVLARAPQSEDGHSSMMGHMDIDGKQHTRSPAVTYGREYAIKCLSKANLNNEALTAQMEEVTIHQSLKPHPNIVTLHRTLETSSFLLLLLEYVPGQDLFYFLEQARDHYESANTPDSDDASTSASRTPPTPSLLSTMNSAQLLSRTRLRLISSMFVQMCDAVAACHAQQVFHRDIKPENFIVTDGYADVDGRRERRVVVKLTDFGLSTTDIESSDMDCGSAPYMSYECRNNVAPSYRPRAADVWSLGIVLINMLYHYNPWTDTKDGECSSFDVFRQQPVTFFMQRFVGMTRPVAEHLANRVFNILDDPKDDSDRISAAEFGVWARDLPDLLNPPLNGTGGHHHHPGHARTSSTASLTKGHRISSSIHMSHRPTSRPASGTASTIRTPAIPSRSLSRAGSFGPTFEQTPYEKSEASELSTVIDQDVEEQEPEQELEEEEEQERGRQALVLQEEEQVPDPEIATTGTESRSPSANKRRKRGARKGKGSQSQSQPPPPTPKDETLETLAEASQTLAREISKASRAASQASSRRSVTTQSSGKSTRSSARSRQPFEPVSMYAVPFGMLPKQPPPPVPPLPKLTPAHRAEPPAALASSSAQPPSTITKKPSKWKLSFGRSSASVLGRVSPVEETPPVLPSGLAAAAPQSVEPTMPPPPPVNSSKVDKVTSLLMGLDAAPPQNSPPPSADDYGRGRRGARYPPSASTPSLEPGFGRRGGYGSASRSPHSHGYPASLYAGSDGHSSSQHGWATPDSDRAVSPNSLRSSHRPVASSASSIASSNWRSSTSTTSSAGTSTSAFTRYSNASAKSVSTMATSVSASSWRTGNGTTATNGDKPPPASAMHSTHPNIPKNVKILNGVPWELDQLPRGQYPHPVGDIFGSPPVRQPRTRKPKDLALGTISERGPPASAAAATSAGPQKSPVFIRSDASTSTTDLDAGSPTRDEEGSSQNGGSANGGAEGPKKVPKAQINALAKMLSALRR